MIERKHRYGNLVFDRDAIVRAALRAYVEAIFGNFPLKRLSFPASAVPRWTGDLERGAFCNDDQCGAYEVVAWTEAGVVGLAFELGWGPIEQLGLSVDAVTGGPDDVRGALPGLPDELEPALVMATAMLGDGPEHGEKMAGVGFWLYGDHVAGTLFDDPTACGADRLVMWGMLRGGRLLPSIARSSHPHNRAIVAECARKDAPIHALIDAVVDRRMRGPTELTTAELELLFPTPPDPKHLLGAQRRLQDVGITWPGSPKLPEKPRHYRRRNPFLPQPVTTTVHTRRPGCFAGQETIVRAALRAYVENILAWLDPLERHPFAASFVPRWTGNLKRGAFFNGDGRGSYEVVAWSEAGVVGLAYQLGYGPIEQLELSIDAVTGGPDDVRAALTELPAELLPTFEQAVGLLEVGPKHGEKLADVGFWLHGEQVGGLLFDHYLLEGAPRLCAWRSLKGGRLRRWSEGVYVADLGPKTAAPIHALADAVTDRALTGPTELTTDELATLIPTPPDPTRLRAAQRMLQKVGITWPGSPVLPD
jgi:hypothetical protein